MEPKTLFPCSQQPVFGAYPGPDESGMDLHTLFYTITSNITLPSALKSSKFYLPFHNFHTKYCVNFSLLPRVLYTPIVWFSLFLSFQRYLAKTVKGVNIYDTIQALFIVTCKDTRVTLLSADMVTYFHSYWTSADFGALPASTAARHDRTKLQILVITN
jgi:hypothetical protein